jgi:hypothetical protein
MNTSYGQQYYTSDPLPIQRPDPLPIQRPIHQQETVGEIKAVVTPLPIPPAAAPPAHSGIVHSPIDRLASHAQRVIEQYSEEILKGITHCHCDSCKTFVKTLLSDAIGEVLTDTTIVKLALDKQQREFERFTDAIERLLPNTFGRETRR